MELRHLRYFLALAEELHFTRAAERLNIEQPPLSRTIKELEDDLGVRLFNRNRRGTLLTPAGEFFVHEVHRVFSALDQATAGVRAAADSRCGPLRIALSEETAQPRLAALLALCREEAPDVEVRLKEVSLAEQLRGLHDDMFDVGFARSNDVGDGIEATAIWQDSLAVVVSSRHPLLAHAQIPIDELLHYPLIVYHPKAGDGYVRQIESVLHRADTRLTIIDQATSSEMMLTLVAAGYGVGFLAAEQATVCRHPDVVVRPLDLDNVTLTTYLLVKSNVDMSTELESFVARAMRHYSAWL